MSLRIQGELEIDAARGVIYFHANDTSVIKRYGTVTVLRVQNVAITTDRQIDLRMPDTLQKLTIKSYNYPSNDFISGEGSYNERES